MEPENIMLIIAPFIFAIAIFFLYLSHLQEIEYKKQKVLRRIVQKDIKSASKHDMKSHLSHYYEDYDITPELVKYFIDNYQSVLLEELEKTNKRHLLHDPTLHTPVKAQLDIENMTKRLERMRVQQGKGG